MRYMLMMQGTQAGWKSFGAWPPEAIQAHIAFMKDFNDKLKKAGELVFAEGLSGPEEAKIVRAGTNGVPAITDGPFPEAKEFLAGFWIVEVPTPERAYEIAAGASAAPGPNGEPLGIPIEVRHVPAMPPA